MQEGIAQTTYSVLAESSEQCQSCILQYGQATPAEAVYN